MTTMLASATPAVRRRELGAAVAIVLMLCITTLAQTAAQGPPAAPLPSELASPSAAPEQREQLVELKHAAQRLPLAAALAAVLALRPRRRGTPPRRPAVVQTQIILSLIGVVVMIVVGASLARAFGIVGAAGLVRYRAKVEDPKDAGVMLSTLAVGLASGVGLWMLAIFGTLFILLVLWIIESFEPMAMRRFSLRVKAKDPAALKARVEGLLDRQQATYEIRAVTPEELHYEVRWPLDRNTDRLSERIVAMDPSEGTEVELEMLKEKP